MLRAVPSSAKVNGTKGAWGVRLSAWAMARDAAQAHAGSAIGPTAVAEERTRGQAKALSSGLRDRTPRRIKGGGGRRFPAIVRRTTRKQKAARRPAAKEARNSAQPSRRAMATSGEKAFRARRKASRVGASSVDRQTRQALCRAVQSSWQRSDHQRQRWRAGPARHRVTPACSAQYQKAEKTLQATASRHAGL